MSDPAGAGVSVYFPSYTSAINAIKILKKVCQGKSKDDKCHQNERNFDDIIRNSGSVPRRTFGLSLPEEAEKRKISLK
jgi:hypothetical protein